MVPAACDLQAFNTFGLAAHADACVTLVQPAQVEALAWMAGRYSSLLVLGGGSNLVLPSVVPGLVARMAIEGVKLVAEDDDARIVEAAAGEVWHDFVALCVARGWNGLENLALIPGTVGASPVQNIGAYGIEIRDRFHSLTAYDLRTGTWVEMGPADCRFAYRDSVFKHEPDRWVVTAVRFRLPKAWQPVLDYPDLQRHPALAGRAPRAQEIFEAVCEIRRAKLPDPALIGNAGSFFKNPVVTRQAYEALKGAHPDLIAYAQPDGSWKLAAGWLIDRCGWKGRSLGRAGVHERQALVLVNRGGAQATDILALADAIRADVLARYGVALEAEPVVVASA